MTRNFVRAAAVAIVGCAAIGARLDAFRTPVLRPNSQLTEPGIVSGEIRFDSADGAPAKSVDVRISDSDTGVEVARDQTDREGRFTLRVAPGRYVVSAGGHGSSLAVTNYGSRVAGFPGSPVVVRAADRIEIKLTGHRAAVVSGVVRDDRGRSVANASIEFEPRPATSGWRRTGLAVTAATSADGAYRVYGVEPGTYVAFAGVTTSPIPGREASSTRSAAAARFFPSAENESDAAIIVLQPGDDRADVNLTLPVRPVIDLSGTAIPPDGITLGSNFFVVASSLTGPLVQSLGYAKDGGEFFLAVQPGRYELDIRAGGAPAASSAQPAVREYYARRILEVGYENLQRFAVPLAPGFSVSGRVQSGDRPLGGVGIRLVPVLTSRLAVRETQTTSANDGLFFVEPVAPGRYSIELADSATAKWAIDSVRLRDGSTRDRTIQVDRSIAAEELELKIVPKTASLSGRVIGAADTAVSSYVALLLSADAGANTTTVGLARPDNTGRYLFSHQTAGAYWLFLLADPEPSDIDLLIKNPDPSHPGGLPVMLKADTMVTMDLQVRR